MPLCIDCHAHFLPDEFIASLRRRGLVDARKDERVLDLDRSVCGYTAAHTRLPYFPLLYDLDARASLAAEQGIDRQILCLPPFYFAYRADPEVGAAICRDGNDALAAVVARSPQRFAAFATVPIQGDSGGWLETSANEWCGVLVAVDHMMGYALEADDTLVAANAAFGTQLQLA